MGILSSLTGAQKTKVPASGFYSQLPEYQSLYKNILGQAGNVAGNLNTDAFTPLATTADEQRAFDLMRAGLAPTEQSIKQDASIFMNPFDSFVTDAINREAMGQNSLVNQAATQAGQQGSNRSFLGTSDVEQNRLNNIGQFRQQAYQTAVNNILGPLSNLRQQDITNLLGIGGFERGLDTQTKQAPYSAINANLGVLNQIPTQFGNFGTQAQTIKTGGGLGGILGGIGNAGGILSGLGGVANAAGYTGLGSQLGTFGTALGFFSDIRLKEGLELVGEENGFDVYRFKYKDQPDKTYIGVIAQDVQKIRPDAVNKDPETGYLRVNYDKIGIQMREVELG